MSQSVTVIIPAYKVSKTISRTIESVLAQPQCDPKIVAVIDGPDEPTAKALEPYANRVQVIQVPENRGLQATRTRGLAEANEDGFAIFLDGDDYWSGDLLGAGARQMIETEADIGLARMEVKSEESGHSRMISLAPADRNALFSGWLGQNRFVAPLCVLWRVSFLRAVGGFDPDLHRQEDGELIMRSLMRGARVTHLRSGHGVYVQHRSPDRLTVRNDHLKSMLDVSAKILAIESNEIPQDLIRRSVAESYANAERTFRLRGYPDLAREASARAAALGGARAHADAPFDFLYRMLSMSLASRAEATIRRIARKPY